MFKHILKSNYKIYDMQAFYSKSKDIPESGSELPHTDTEPAPPLNASLILPMLTKIMRWP